VPGTVVALEALPGVGPYTSRAVAALAFGRPVAAVDTNVRRVITRLSGQALAGPDLQRAADALVAREDPATWNHAAMELGATVCRARHPDCAACPVSGWCVSAYRNGVVGGRGSSAAESVQARTPRRVASVPYEHTTRWLRGRIVARLRDAEDGAWTQLPGWLGGHGPESVAAAVAALERDGLLERCAHGAVRLPSAAP